MANDQYFNVSGRLVQGDVFKPQTLDMKGRPMTDKNGNPKVQYFAGVAVAKNAPDFQPAFQGMQSVAMAEFRNQEYTRPLFAWKLADGDLPENANKEGFPGHWVFRFSSGYPFRVVSKGAARPIVNPEEVKRGYYVRVFFTVAANTDPQKPGLFLNGSIVELLGYGPEISAGPDAAALIAAAGGGYIPAGASHTPLGGPALAVQGPPVYPAPPVYPQQTAPPVYPAPPAAPGIPPYYNILNPGGQQ